MRGLAACAVLGYHGFSSLLPGAKLAVDVFFALSGFVVTLSVLSAVRRGRFTFGSFWSARARRLLPAAVLVLAVSAVLAAVADPDHVGAQLWHVMFSGVAVENLYVTVQAYAPRPQSFAVVSSHFWSLAAETQFYLLLSAAVLVAARSLRPRRVVGIAAAAVVAVGGLVSVLSYAGVLAGPAWGYFSPLARVWEPAVGVLAAVAVSSPRTARVVAGVRGWVASVVTGVALVVIVVLWWRPDVLGAGPAIPGPAMWVTLVATTGVLLFGARARVSAALLGSAVGRWAGARSYSVYLWHFPVLVGAFMCGLGSTLGKLAALGLSVAAAELTYRTVELRWLHPRASTASG